MTMQLTLEGEKVVVGGIREKIAYILETFPETQERYMALYLEYYTQFRGLRKIVESGDWERFKRFWLYEAENPKTLLQRCQEVQNKRPELEPAEVREKRLKQSRQGPIG